MPVTAFASHLGSVVLGRDNLVAVRIFESGARKTDLSGLTRVVLSLGSHSFDSDTDAIFDWLTYSDDGGDLVALELGGEAIAAGDYHAAFTYYDATHTGGVRAEDPAPLRVRAAATGTAPAAL